MKTTALVSALLLATSSMAYAQGGPDGPIGGGGPAGAIDGPGGGAPAPGLGGGGPGDGGPAMRGPDGPGPGAPDIGGSSSRGAEGQSTGEAGADGSPVDTPPAAREPGGDGRADRPDRGARKAAEDAGDGARKAGKSAEGAGSEAKRKTREAADKATPEKSDKDSAGRKDAADQKSGDATKEARDKAGDKETPRADTAESAKVERAKSVELSGEKRDRIQTVLRDKPDVKHRKNVNIDISIGRRLPRDWDFAPLPVVVLEVVPEYRDYVYVWVEDDYLICDPVTYEVVAVIPAGGGSRAAAGYGSGGSGKCSARLELSRNERELILDTVRLGREVDVSNLEIGWSVPGDIELQRFPDAVLAEAAELRACRYFVADDQLAIVDPDEDKVVLLIDKS